MGTSKKKDDNNGGSEYKLTPIEDLNKMRKSDLVSMVGAVEAELAEMTDERDNFKVIVDNTDKMLGDMRKQLEKAKGDVSKARQSCDANKVLVEDLTSQYELLKNFSSREIETLRNRVSELESALNAVMNRSLWQRILNKRD